MKLFLIILEVILNFYGYFLKITSKILREVAERTAIACDFGEIQTGPHNRGLSPEFQTFRAISKRQSQKILRGRGVGVRIGYHLSFWRFFRCFIAIFGPIWGQSMKRGHLWCCDVFPCFKGISDGFGVLDPESPICPFRARIWPFQAPNTLPFKGKMAKFEAKNTVKQGKKTPKGQMVPNSRVYGKGVLPQRVLVYCFLFCPYTMLVFPGFGGLDRSFLRIKFSPPPPTPELLSK